MSQAGDATSLGIGTKNGRIAAAVFIEFLVGVRGFEPPASTSRT